VLAGFDRRPPQSKEQLWKTFPKIPDHGSGDATEPRNHRSPIFYEKPKAFNFS
jgi:hypothetical protein